MKDSVDRFIMYVTKQLTCTYNIINKVCGQ